jgi:hypothetical protein
MSEAVNETKVIALKHSKAMVLEILEKVAEKAIMEAVAKSESKIDDLVAAALVPTLKAALVEQISKLEV